jgi:protocatechuate 3,4-dioxygenase beta subunit
MLTAIRSTGFLASRTRSDATAEGTDPVFACVPSALRPRLIARRDPSLDEEGLPAYRFDVILRGDGETPFFLD